MFDQFVSFYDNLPIARVFYSLLLLGVVFLLIGQFASIWRHSKISISDFSYFADGKKNADYADQFRSETIANYSMIFGFIKSDRFNIDREGEDNGISCVPEHTRWYRSIIAFFHAPEAENRCQESNKGDLDAQAVSELLNSIRAEKVDEIAKTLDITVEGVNLKGLISAFNNLLAPPKTTIVASLYETGGKKRAYVSLNDESARRAKAFTRAPLVSALDVAGSNSQNAFRIACYLIWIQVNKKPDDDGNDEAADPAMSFEEFYDWARILQAKNVLEAAEGYRVDDRKKEVDVALIKQQIVRAVRREIGFRGSYASLSGFEKYFYGEIVKLDDAIEAQINSVADLIRYFAITGKSASDGSSVEWLKRITSPAATREQVNRAFFDETISTDCSPNKDIDKEILKGTSNIVRIERGYTDRRTHEKRLSISTGLLIENGVVLTVFSGPQTDERLKYAFAETAVRFIGCKHVGDGFAVTSAAFAVTAGKSPFVLLTVPNLKQQGENPKRDFSGLDINSSVVVAGQIRDRSLMFAGRNAASPNDPANPQDAAIYFLSGQTVATFQSDFAEDSENRVYLDVPFTAGLYGAPIYDDEGTLVGFVESQLPVGKSLSLAVGVPISSLKNLPALTNKSVSKEE